MVYNVITVGVGGQGLMLLSNIIGLACAETGIEIRTAETHGLAQRSGSIYTHIRIGDGVFSPLIPYGCADVMVAMEAMEALRQCEYIKKDATIILNDYIWQPVQSTFNRVKTKGETTYVSIREIEEKLGKITSHVNIIDCTSLARQAGNPLTSNTVLLGALAKIEGFPVPLEAIQKVLPQVVPPKALDANIRALKLGNSSI